MTEREIKVFAKALAVIYFERRESWYRSVDGVIKARWGNSVRDYDIATEIKNNAVARWDQINEITQTLPQEIRTPMLEEVENLESGRKSNEYGSHS